jgi:hypothetical protein
MASDVHVATALTAFAKDVRRTSRSDSGLTARLSPEQAAIRRERLDQLAAEAERLASNPREATYQGFERIWKQVEGLGAPPGREIIIAVASAFMQRPYVSTIKGPMER